MADQPGHGLRGALKEVIWCILAGAEREVRPLNVALGASPGQRTFFYSPTCRLEASLGPTPLE